MNNLTLYHSTTDFYLSSIREYGLGKINPNVSNGILDFLKDLYSLSEKYLTKNSDYQKIQFTTDGMANQSIKGFFNFKHDKTYLTINEATAIRYSLNKYGSELLSRSIILYKMLIKNGHKEKIDTSMLKFDIEKIIEKPHNIILLKVNNINPINLETEIGENAILKLNEIEELKKTDIETYNVLSQQFNFALTKPIDFINIDVYKIEIIRVNGFEIDYELDNYVG